MDTHCAFSMLRDPTAVYRINGNWCDGRNARKEIKRKKQAKKATNVAQPRQKLSQSTEKFWLDYPSQKRSAPGLSPVAGGFPFAFPYGLPPSSPLCTQFPLLPVFGPLLDPQMEEDFDKSPSPANSHSAAAAARRFLPAAAAAAAAAQYPAAAAVLPYLPPSLAALSLPSQNWCAKCQTSFRMTSDLVYHMRSHHKREPDPAKKRREDKLRCHICHESFRERHHLTRHMTSHQ
ncbi:hypothetical protein HPB48_020280 [Haemaphysalis longicornis]|uniref:C2H2-type domain-containing protein n=1 Tax=Haemaphysalis longicornis TaxID=44386 RepID=A0A9J6FD65_HAELO|nr:hypothetical protein HPB48_020280 [Haemaphysalis longicornis]